MSGDRLTPELWARQQQFIDEGYGDLGDACLMDLHARVEALEQRPIPGTAELTADHLVGASKMVPTPEAAPVAMELDPTLISFYPRLIALATSSEQIPPGPHSEDDLRRQWNAQADDYKRWESLDLSEQLAWAQARAIAAVWRPTPEPAPVATDEELLAMRSWSGHGPTFDSDLVEFGRNCYDRGRQHGAAQLQQQAAPAPVLVPVAVSERLPGEGDFDTEESHG